MEKKSSKTSKKNLYFGTKIIEHCKKVVKNIEKVGVQEKISNPSSVGYLTERIYYTRHQRVRNTKSACHGRFQEKDIKSSTELNNFH